MKENSSALYSEYIIDGVRMDESPAQMLRECMPPDIAGKVSIRKGEFAPVIDESRDPSPGISRYDRTEMAEYMRRSLEFLEKPRPFELSFPAFFTKMKIASAIIDGLWKEGHFRLEDIRLDAKWDWDSMPVGNMAAFHASAEAAGEYIYDLGASLEHFSFREDGGPCRVDFHVCGTSVSNTEPIPEEDAAFGQDKEEIWISDRRKCPDTASDDPKSWLIYIPFDTCAHRLGGSVLERIAGCPGDTAPEIRDPDYFMDCHEVVRELVEDGIIMSAVTVSDGGLMTAAGRLCAGTGADIDVSGIASSYMENDMMKILFAEIPGVLIQISDSDYDYTDAQLIMQEIAYYSVGRPGGSNGKVTAGHGNRSDVAGILASLIYGQDSSEGED